MKTKLIAFLSILLFLYLLICTLMYIFQEQMIFYPQSVAKDYHFADYDNYEERFIEMSDGIKLHSLLFKTKAPRGVIFFLHGNAGSLVEWGNIASSFTDLGYNVFMPDYRGYGKSEGSIASEARLHKDVQRLYDTLKKDYPEEEIIVLGHSIGAGMAAKLAANNNFRLLILQAAPYSLPDLARKITLFKIFPTFLLRYKFPTGKYVKAANMPVVVVHGEEDQVVYYGSAQKIQRHFKDEDTLITLEGLGHNNFLYTHQYRKEITGVLDQKP